MRFVVIIALCLAVAQASAQGVSIAPADTIPSIVVAQKGKSVTLRLRSGQELTGVVRQATDRLVVLGELSGREFFDAVIPMESVEAVIIRTRS